MESFRTFTVHGQSEPNTSITVLVDGVVCKDGLVDGTELFSFENNVTCYGKVDIHIRVNSGSIILGQTTVVYPALYATSILSKYNKGTLKFKQPFDSKYLFSDGILSRLSFDTTTINDHIQFDHLTFNGPNRFLLVSETNTDFNLDYTGIKNFPIMEILIKDSSIPVRQFMPIYDYKNVAIDWSTKEGLLRSLNDLLIHVYGKTV